MVALGAVMLLIITALLVGPAFAVSAARQRRTLALAASNGASTAVLRRTVLAQALVLGTASALLGVLLGVAAARGVGIAEKIELVAVLVHLLRVLGRAGAEKRKQED